MNIFNRKQKPVHPLHRKVSWREQARDFWLTNQGLFGVIIILTCISILIGMMGFVAASKGYFLFSTESNHYEHLAQIVCCIGVVIQ